MSYVLRHTMRFQATTLDGTIVIDLASRYSLQIRLFTFRSRKAATFTIIMLSINKMSSNLDTWKKNLRSFFYRHYTLIRSIIATLWRLLRWFHSRSRVTCSSLIIKQANRYVTRITGEWITRSLLSMKNRLRKASGSSERQKFVVTFPETYHYQQQTMVT